MQLEHGASLLEMLFAIALVSLAMPFAYRQIASLGEDLKVMGIAKQLVQDSAPIKNHLRVYAEEFPAGELVKVEIDRKDHQVFILNSGEITSAFVVVQSYREDILKSHKIARMLGFDAAVVESDFIAYSGAGGWSVLIPESRPGDLVYRIILPRREDDTARYLHRTVLSEDELSSMKRDLLMDGFSLININETGAEKLVSTDLDTFLARTPVIAANALYFSGGLNLNPEKSTLRNIRVNGDAIGFRNIFADILNSQGTLTTDRAAISTQLTVSDNFEVKAPYSKTVSGFAGVTAGNVKTSYLDATTLTFFPGFGLTVSGETLYSGTPPIKLGQWTFPGTNSPRFSELRLANLGGRTLAPQVPDFSEILKDGWR